MPKIISKNTKKSIIKFYYMFRRDDSQGTEEVYLNKISKVFGVSAEVSGDTPRNQTEDVNTLYQQVKEKTENETNLAKKLFEDRLKDILNHKSYAANEADGPYKWFDRAVDLYYQFYNVSAEEALKYNVNLTECFLPISVEILSNLSDTHRKRMEACLDKYTNITIDVLEEANRSITTLNNYTKYFDEQLKNCENSTVNLNSTNCFENIKDIMRGWVHVVPDKVVNYVDKIDLQLDSLKAENDICSAGVIIDLGAEMDPTLTQDNECVTRKLKASENVKYSNLTDLKAPTEDNVAADNSGTPRNVMVVL